MPLKFIHKYSIVYIVLGTYISAASEGQTGDQLMSNSSSVVSRLPEFTYLQCFQGLALANPPLYAVSHLGNQFLCLVATSI